jgi:hypothetical protein
MRLGQGAWEKDDFPYLLEGVTESCETLAANTFFSAVESCHLVSLDLFNYMNHHALVAP